MIPNKVVGQNCIPKSPPSAVPARLSLLCCCALLSLVYALLFASFSVAASTEPSLSLEPKQAKIGDPIQVTLIVPRAAAGKISWPAITDQLGDFTLLSADTLTGKEAKKAGGEGIVWTVAAYDTGSFSTGDLTLNLGSGEITLAGQTARIIPSVTDTTDVQFRPFKAQVNLKYTFRDILNLFWPWFAAAAGIALIILLIRRIRKTKGRILSGIIVEKPLPPPYDEAIWALRDLQRDNPLARGDIKGYVSRLTEIPKRLLERVYGAPVLEMTTWDVKKWLIHEEIVGDATGFLSLLVEADGIKFARMALGPDQASGMIQFVEKFVDAYKPQPGMDYSPTLTSSAEAGNGIGSTRIDNSNAMAPDAKESGQ